MKFFIRLLSVFILAVCASQSSIAQFTVSGNISEATSGKTLGFASITADDGSKKTIAIADSTGNFSLSDLHGGHYSLLFSLIGYQDSSLNLELNKDTVVHIQMQSGSGLLQDVAVQSSKPMIEQKSDRYVLNVAGNIATQGKQTTDILKYAPGIFISNRVLSMAGKANVIVYINDFQVRMDAKTLPEYLNSLSPKDIQSIEIISTPPANYDAAGNTGIVKIVMKKNIHPGWKGYAQANYTRNTYSGVDGDAGLDYIGGKIAVTATVYGGNSNDLAKNQYTNYYPSETASTLNPKKDYWKGLGGTININYKIDSNSSLNLVYQTTPTAKAGLKDIINRTDYINNTNNLIDSSLLSNGASVYHFKRQNIDLFFKHNLKKEDSYFDVEFSWLNHYNGSDRPFSSVTLINGDSSDFGAYESKGTSNNNTYTAQTDFVFPFKKWNLNFGGKTTFIKNTAGYNYFDLTDNVQNLLQNNTFDYTENTQALYATANMDLKKWLFKAGLRGEATQAAGNSLAIDSSFHRNYLELFPTLYVSYNLNKKDDIHFSYGRRIDRPSYVSLDPFKYYISKYDYAEGNPFLLPAFTNTLELAYTHNNSFTARLYYNSVSNALGDYVILDSANVNTSVQEAGNFLDMRTAGFSIYKLYNKINWWECVAQADFSYSKFISRNAAIANNKGYGGTVTLNNTFYFDKGKNIQGILNLQDQIPGNYDYRNRKNSFELDTGINYTLVNKLFEFSVMANDIFKTATPRFWYVTNGIRENYNNYFDSRYITVSVKYNFGNRFIKNENANRTLNNNDEKNRL